MINFLQILNKDKEVIQIIDVANSIIWHSSYYGVGDFEIYTKLTPEIVENAVIGNYIRREDESEIGIIENITVTFSLESGYMVTVSGRMLKSILDRRVVYNLSENLNLPTIFPENTTVESAARQLVYNNAISCVFDSNRNMTELVLGELKNLPKIIVDEDGNAAQKQVATENLLESTDALLKEYEYGSRITLRSSDGKFVYEVYEGADRSFDNNVGNMPVVFSTDFDNLNGCEYQMSDTLLKNGAIIGGSGEDADRFFSKVSEGKSGLELREIFIDASSINRTYYEEGNSEEQTYSDEVYSEMLEQQAQKAMNTLTETELFGGNINVNSTTFIYKKDYFLGDVVSIQDNVLNKYANVRIAEVTEVQDENGYRIDINFESEE